MARTVGYAELLAIVGQVCNLGEVFDSADIRDLVHGDHRVKDEVNSAICGLTRMADPVFERIAPGRYRWLRYHVVTVYKAQDVPRVIDGGTCPLCFIAIPSSGACDCAE